MDYSLDELETMAKYYDVSTVGAKQTLVERLASYTNKRAHFNGLLS